MMEKWQLVNYFDVWGNEEDGYEVNNLCKEGIVETPENATKEQLLEALIEFGFFNEKAREAVYVDYNSSPDMIEFYEEANNKPLCRLEAIYE